MPRAGSSTQRLADARRQDDGAPHDLSTGVARELREEIAQVGRCATAAVADVRQFHAVRLQDAGAFPEVTHGPVVADFANLRSCLARCRGVLELVSKQCTEHEQRLQARKLVQDAEASLQQLAAIHAYAFAESCCAHTPGGNCQHTYASAEG